MVQLKVQNSFDSKTKSVRPYFSWLPGVYKFINIFYLQTYMHKFINTFYLKTYMYKFINTFYLKTYSY